MVPQPWVQFIYFNCGKAHFKDAKIRCAPYVACEMQKSIDDIYYGNTPRTLSYLQPAHWSYHPHLKDPTPNPDAAA